MKKVNVSIIVPIYNMEKCLERCIESLITQTYKEIEIILILDGCTDRSYEICKEFQNSDKRIYIYEKSNGGVSSSRNYGVEKAKGRYIMFVDPDDWIDKDTVEKSISVMQNNCADILQFSYRKIYENKINTDVNIEDSIIDKEQCILATISEQYGNVVLNKSFGQIRAVWGKIYNYKVIKDIKFFEDIYIFEDGIFNLYAFFNANKIIFYNQALYNYNISSTSANNKYKADCIEQCEKILKYIKEFIENNDINCRDAYKLLVYENFMRVLNQNICNEENSKGIFEKIKIIENIANSTLYENELTCLDFKYLNTKNKIVLYLIKRKLFSILFFINELKRRIKK